MLLKEAMSQNITVVDAFTEQPFRGNPAAVCILGEGADDTWMQRVAREMNLSETAFLHPEGGDFRLRWFTPTVEVPWGERLGKTDLVAHEVSQRGGVIRVGLRGDRVELGGHAVTVLRAELLA
jgi:predicted PhzF superfamily epimerase YddE/YHI9